MHGSKVSLRIWIFVIFEMAANKNGIAAREIERKYGVASRTAWFMTQRIREAMDQNASPFTGVVVADETSIGGEPKNRHAHKRMSVQGLTDKTPILSLINAKTGEVRSRVVADVTRDTLRQVIAEETVMARTMLHTDSASSYTKIGREMAGHGAINHKAGEYVRDGISTNKAENFFSQLKRSIDGTHHHVSREHLHRYLAEFDFRHSTHRESDTARFHMLMEMLGGKRLTYKIVTG